MHPAAGLGFGVSGNPGSGTGALCCQQGLQSPPARLSDGQPGGEEKECAAISQRLLRQMRAAGIVGEQDARNVHFPFGPGAVQRCILKEPGRGQDREFTAHSRRAGSEKGKARGGRYFTMTRFVTTASRPAARPRRRTRHQGRRGRTVRFALTEEEYAEVSAAARQAGLARGAYAAEATLAVARGAVTTAGRAAAGRLLRPGPRRAAGAPDRRQLEPGGREAERDRAVVW